MPRKGPAPKHPVVTDPVYGSPLVTSLINKVLVGGKRSVAERIVYGALEGCRVKSDTDPVITLKRALDNVKPTLEVRSRRVGGATYQVPIEVRAGRSNTLALQLPSIGAFQIKTQELSVNGELLVKNSLPTKTSIAVPRSEIVCIKLPSDWEKTIVWTGSYRVGCFNGKFEEATTKIGPKILGNI